MDAGVYCTRNGEGTPMLRYVVRGVRTSRLYPGGTTPAGGWDKRAFTTLSLLPDGRLLARCATPRGIDVVELAYRPARPDDPLPLAQQPPPRQRAWLLPPPALPAPWEWEV